MVSVPELTDMDLEKLQHAYEDLKSIAETTDNLDKMTEHRAGMLSVMLRRLLIDDQFIQCWKLIGMATKRPSIVASYLAPDGARGSTAAFASTVQMSFGQIGPVVAYHHRTSNRPEWDDFKIEKGETLSLQEFLNSVIGAANGHEFSRAHVIKYVANKRGGAHYDPTRKAHEETFKHMDEIKTFFIGGRPRMKYGREVKRNGKVVLEGRLSFPHAGILSIAQDITASLDVKSFMNLAQELVG